MAETKYGGTVTNVKRKRVLGGGSSYRKITRTEACVDMFDIQPTTVKVSVCISLIKCTLFIVMACVGNWHR